LNKQSSAPIKEERRLWKRNAEPKSELREGEEQETALLAKAVKVTTEGMSRPHDFRSRTVRELHKCLAEFFFKNCDNESSPNDSAGEPY
jgi:hypothetical protein